MECNHNNSVSDSGRKYDAVVDKVSKAIWNGFKRKKSMLDTNGIEKGIRNYDNFIVKLLSCGDATTVLK